MTPRQILWDLPLAQGRQYVTLWWNLYFDATGKRGVPCNRVNSTAARDEFERIAG